jgi:hypothetical protein
MSGAKRVVASKQHCGKSSQGKSAEGVLWLVAELRGEDDVKSVTEMYRRLDAWIEQNTRVIHARLERTVV